MGAIRGDSRFSAIRRWSRRRSAVEGTMSEERFNEFDRIRGIREDDSLRQDMRAGFAMILKRLHDHAIPGEAADRAQRTTTIERRSS